MANKFLWDVSEKELREAVIDMVRKLGIPGSVGGGYDLYVVINKEHDKAVAYKKQQEELEESLS